MENKHFSRSDWIGIILELSVLFTVILASFGYPVLAGALLAVFISLVGMVLLFIIGDGDN